MNEVYKEHGTSSIDSVGNTIETIAKSIFLALFGLLPILFIPATFVNVGTTKTFLALFVVLIAFIFYSLSVLRSGTIRFSGGKVVAALWVVAGVALTSSALSGDFYDSFIGDTMSVHSSLFLLLLASIVTFLTLAGKDKGFLMHIYMLLAVSAVLLGFFHIARFIFGADFLTLGIFNSSTSSPFGAWNDVAIFYGLCVILSLLALEQLPLTKSGKALFSGVVAVALLLLAVINFFAVWIILGIVGLVVVMYTLTKERFSETTSLEAVSKEKPSTYSLVVSSVVFVVSLVFVVGGSLIGSSVSDLVGIEYVEVRPSIEATADIARNVYSENALLGVGPNKFVDAWRQYQDISLNQSIFWNTNFTSGSGYLPTQFAAGGILTVVAWVVFLGLFFIGGFINLFRSAHRDRFWFFITSSSFVAAGYLWGMALIHNPSATVLLLAALFTGIYLTAMSGVHKSLETTYVLAANRRTGLLLVALTMVVIVASSAALYATGRHYVGVHSFTKAVVNEASLPLEEVEARIANAYTLVNTDTFARQLAQYQVAKINALINVEEPTPEQQNVFEQAVANGVAAAERAVTLDNTEPANWETLGNLYSLLAVVGVEGASARALESYTSAQALAPNNPSYNVLRAQVQIRAGDAAAAEAEVQSALTLKSNYTDAMYLLSQIKIAEGQVEEAITAARGLVTVEPQNPAVHYYLGILYSSNNDTEAAIAAFQQAVALNPQYANARYFLALSYIQNDQLDLARTQLETVLETNPGNETVESLISQIDNGTIDVAEAPEVAPETSEPAAVVENDDGTVTTDGETGTDLIVPVNPVTSESNSDQAATNEADTASE